MDTPFVDTPFGPPRVIPTAEFQDPDSTPDPQSLTSFHLILVVGEGSP